MKFRKFSFLNDKKSLFAPLFLQHRIVNAKQAGNGGSGQHALVASVDSFVEPFDGCFGKEATESDALAINNKRNERLDDAEGQGIDNSLGSLSARASLGSAGGVGGAKIEEITKQAGQDEAGEGPGQSRRPEARSEQEEHVRQVDRVVGSAEEAKSRDSKGIAISQDLRPDIPKFESGDNEENAVHIAQSLAGGIGSLANAALLVKGRDVAAHGQGGAVDSLSDVGRRGGKRNARGDAGQAASGSLDEGSRGGADIFAISRERVRQTRKHLGTQRLSRSRGGERWREYVRRNQVLGSLGDPPLGGLEALLDLLLDGLLGLLGLFGFLGLLGLALDGRTQRLGPAGEVARQLRSGGKAAAVPRNEVVESGLELRLFETIVASCRGERMLAWFLFCFVCWSTECEVGNAATRQRETGSGGIG